MRLLNISLFILLTGLVATNLEAQTEKKSYNLKKGQVFDIIFLSNKPDVDVKLQDYFKRAFPLANAEGYHSLIGFGIKENNQGNYHPQSMIFGYWDDLKGRERFLKTVDTKMTDFHQMRREIWSTFALTYWELEEDISFEVDPAKFNVVTAYWKKEGQSMESFKKKWQSKSRKAGGETLVAFSEGTSPFGYYYAPDYLVITSWDSRKSFEAFYEQNLKMDHSTIKHVNQFIF
ncbi:MAG: hypothetical protein HEP71_10040 [Roseivirga sp.]|nr:hypothetical protein [Roseivirga sp.]